MTLLNAADEIWLGDREVQEVWLGDEPVWPPDLVAAHAHTAQAEAPDNEEVTE